MNSICFQEILQILYKPWKILKLNLSPNHTVVHLAQNIPETFPPLRNTLGLELPPACAHMLVSGRCLCAFCLHTTGFSRANLQCKNQGGKRPGGETGSPLLGQCVMRRKTGTSAPCALPVQFNGCQKSPHDKPEMTFSFFIFKLPVTSF